MGTAGEDISTSHYVDNQLAETNIMRHLPQLRRLQGTPAYSIVTNLCYLAQSHIENAWHPQNRGKALLFFQMAQIHISEMLLHTACQDVTDVLKTIRARIAAMEFLVKTVEISSISYSHNWRQALDPIVQMFKNVKLECQATADDMNTDSSTCVEDSSDNDSIIRSLKPTLAFCKSSDTKLDSVTCIKSLEEPLYRPEVEVIPEYSSPSTCFGMGNRNIIVIPTKMTKEPINAFHGIQCNADEVEDIDRADDDTSSEYLPLDDSISVGGTDDEADAFRNSPFSDVDNSIPSSKTSVHDLEPTMDKYEQNSKYNAQTLHYLETMFFEVYSCRDKLSKSERVLIQRQTGLPPRSITYWFANHKRRYQKELQKYRRSMATSYDEYMAISSKNKTIFKGKGQSKK
jgi:Homeodomain